MDMIDMDNHERLKPWLPATYLIEVEGRLTNNCTERFEVMQITTMERADQSVVTSLVGRVKDQSELAGMVDFFAEMHLPIIKIENFAERNGGDES